MTFPPIVLAVLLSPSSLSASSQDRATDTSAASPPSADTAVAYSGPARPIGPTVSCVVRSVTDGDTIRCTSGVRVRLLGIDAPEAAQRPFGRAATEAMRRIVANGDTVLLELDVQRQDQYGRLLAYVWFGDQMVNWLMVASGWAVTLTYPPNVQHVEAFTEAQRTARLGKLGLWAGNGFDCLPRDFRRRRCR